MLSVNKGCTNGLTVCPATALTSRQLATLITSQYRHQVRARHNENMRPVDLLREFVALPGPAGQEVQIREAVARHVDALGLTRSTDAKGNLIVQLGDDPKPNIVVTAHLDEIALIVRRVLPDGRITVGPLGGIHAWKLGEGPVQVLAQAGAIDGVLGFGSVHTESPAATVRQADRGPLLWDHATVLTGVAAADLEKRGVRPGTRVVVHPSRRSLLTLESGHVSSYFLDDRADLVSWLLALADLKDSGVSALFVASAAEEVGGEGALYLMQNIRPEVCIALELGAHVPDAPVMLSDQPTVWVTDSFAAMQASDGDLLARIGEKLGLRLQFQAFSRGGSDASCAASHGLCARPITLGLPMENSHGFEIMHPGAMVTLAMLTSALVRELQK